MSIDSCHAHSVLGPILFTTEKWHFQNILWIGSLVRHSEFQAGVVDRQFKQGVTHMRTHTG